jgi:murein L,D-transpeptidase YcbB/YkuD
MALAAIAAIMPVAAAGQQQSVLQPADPLFEPYAQEEVAPEVDVAAPQSVSVPVVQPLPGEESFQQKMELPLPGWTVSDVEELVAEIDAIGSHGLDPAEYIPDLLRDALLMGEGPQLDQVANMSFAWLVEDLRDGRTPMDSRKQWFVVDPDADRMPTRDLLLQALETHDVTGVLNSLHPTHSDYAALRQTLAETPETDKTKRAMIRANMDRWRWLARDLGHFHLMTNVPEYQLRLSVGEKIVRTYRTVVGKPGSSATPQLAEEVEGIVFNPTWTVPQSIVKGEGLGNRVLNNPSWAKAQGYTATKGANGFISVVQQPGPTNSLGVVKLDMPNPHAIFLHDTPSRNLFNTERRAYSHGCIRTERALELAITLAILGGISKDEAVAMSASRKYTKAELDNKVPVYITYFTMGRDIDGEMRVFEDIYGRDAPVLASFDQPRVANRARVTSEAIVPNEAPGA